MIEDSGLDYNTLRPHWFTNASEVDYVITYKGDPEIGTAISRKRITAFILKVIDNPKNCSKAAFNCYIRPFCKGRDDLNPATFLNMQLEKSTHK